MALLVVSGVGYLLLNSTLAPAAFVSGRWGRCSGDRGRYLPRYPQETDACRRPARVRPATALRGVPDPTAGEGEALVQVTAAGLHPVVKVPAGGAHYGSTDQLALIPGVDGVGRLKDKYPRLLRWPPSAARRSAGRADGCPWPMCLPLPDGPGDATIAAILNPGMSAWLALRWRARLPR